MAAGTRGMARSLSWLAETSWSYLLGLVFFIIASSLILTLGAAPGSGRAAIFTLGIRLIQLLILAKMLSHYRGQVRLRAAAARRAPWSERLAALLPLPLIAWARLDKANLRACLAWLTRRPYDSRPPGHSFGLLKKSGYGTVVLILLIGIFGELPMHATIVGAMVKDPALQQRVQLIMLGLALYSLFWVVGDRRAMLGSSYVLNDSALDIRVGNRFSAVIPLGAIVCCEALKEGEREWRKRNGVPADATLVATPADVPNLMIAINPAANVTVVSWQLARPAPAFLFLFADEPSQLAARLVSQQVGRPA
jgi:hypothetical protein